MKKYCLLLILSLSTVTALSMQIVITEKDGEMIYDVEGEKTDKFDLFLKNVDSKASLHKPSFGDDFIVRCFFVCDIELDKINGINSILKQHGLDHQTLLAIKSPYVPASQMIFTNGKPTEFELRPKIYTLFKEKEKIIEPVK